MKTVIVITCLVAVVFTSPIRKVRDLSSSTEVTVVNPFPFLNNRLFQTGQRLNRFGSPQDPYFNEYVPLYNPNQYLNTNSYIPILNRDPFQRYSYNTPHFNFYPWTASRLNVLPVNSAQVNALSTSTEASSEEDTLVMVPFILEPFSVPGGGVGNNNGVPMVPGDEVPFLPANERPFTPEIDTNAVDAGFNQQNIEELATEVLDPEEPASVLPYTDSVQGMDSLGLNGEDYSMIRDVDEGLSQQDTIYEPVELDEEYDQTLNNEEFSNQQMPTENLDEDDLTLEVETQNIGTNTVSMNSMDFSQEEDNNNGGTESNLNVAVSNNNTPDTQEQDSMQSIEDDLNQINAVGSNQDNSQSIEEDLNQINAVGSNQDNSQSIEEDLNQINAVGSNQDNSQSIEEDLNQINAVGSNQDNTQSIEDDLNQINAVGSNQDNTQSIEDDPNANVAGSNNDDGADFEEDGGNTNSNVNNGAGFIQNENGDGANGDDSSKIDNSNIQNKLDSCKKIHCRHGRICKLSEGGLPTCVCQELMSCPESSLELQQICGTNNVTYGNACQFFASQCLLDGTKSGHNIHLDYVGPCKYISPCLENELEEFPIRLRGWLKNILIQMYEQDLRSPGLLSPKERTTIEKIYEHEHHLQPSDHSLNWLFDDFSQNYQMYIYPVHWQFTQLDHHPVDGYLSHSELAPFRTPLIPLEHCTSRFFSGCDLDGDKDISLREWSRCFGLKEGH
ncbi:uncharacterized protein LOC144486179 isoform X2 [Mustelus asterias]